MKNAKTNVSILAVMCVIAVTILAAALFVNSRKAETPERIFNRVFHGAKETIYVGKAGPMSMDGWRVTQDDSGLARLRDCFRRDGFQIVDDSGSAPLGSYMGICYFSDFESFYTNEFSEEELATRHSKASGDSIILEKEWLNSSGIWTARMRILLRYSVYKHQPLVLIFTMIN